MTAAKAGPSHPPTDPCTPDTVRVTTPGEGALSSVGISDPRVATSRWKSTTPSLESFQPPSKTPLSILNTLDADGVGKGPRGRGWGGGGRARRALCPSSSQTCWMRVALGEMWGHGIGWPYLFRTGRSLQSKTYGTITSSLTVAAT